MGRCTRKKKTGKCTRKAKTTGQVPEISPSSLGVRTRAKTLAPTAATPPPEYLELRSRRLVKNPIPKSHHKGSRSGNSCENEFSGSGSIGRVNKERDSEIDASQFGENSLDLEEGERSTKEKTPCNLVLDVDIFTTPGPNTRHTCPASSRRALNTVFPDGPSASELEEFFTLAEQAGKRLFIDKYNFDIVNDVPLVGHYEWVRVTP